MKYRVSIIVGVLATMLANSFGADTSIEWSAKAIGGETIRVPDKSAPFVLLFAMDGQTRSKEAAAQLAESIKSAGTVRVVMVVSGEGALEHARALAASGLSFPVIADSDYVASGKFDVHVWPTTVFVAADGALLGHVAGFPKSYRSDIEAYLALASGKIDRATLEQRLANHGNIVDDPEQMAARHLSVAERLLDKQLSDAAKSEVAAASNLHPASPQTRLRLASALLAVGQTDEAAKLLPTIDPKQVNPSALNLVRGKLLSAQGKWADAIAPLGAAVELNPQPAEAWYELGKAHEHLKHPAEAAAAYRKAFESTETGKKLRR